VRITIAWFRDSRVALPDVRVVDGANQLSNESWKGEAVRGKPPTPEALLTRSVRQLLNAAGIFHWKNHGGLGSAPGLPDICGVYKGRAIAIELKAPRGVLSPYQQTFIDRINEAGGLAFVAKDLDTVIDKLGLQEKFLIR
jgi:hypothetical protein